MRWKLEAGGKKHLQSLSISTCSVKTPTDPSCFPARCRCHPEGSLWLAMASSPWPAMGGGRKAARAQFGWPWITSVCSGTERDTHTLWFILAFKCLFMGQQKVTNVHLHFPAAYCPFGPNCMFLKNTWATKICNVQTKVSVCSSFATCKYLLWDHPEAPCSCSPWHTIISQVLGYVLHFVPLLKITPSFYLNILWPTHKLTVSTNSIFISNMAKPWGLSGCNFATPLFGPGRRPIQHWNLQTLCSCHADKSANNSMLIDDTLHSSGWGWLYTHSYFYH